MSNTDLAKMVFLGLSVLVMLWNLYRSWKLSDAPIDGEMAAAQMRAAIKAKLTTCPDCGCTRVDLFCSRCGWGDICDARYNVHVHDHRGKRGERVRLKDAIRQTEDQHRRTMREMLSHFELPAAPVGAALAFGPDGKLRPAIAGDTPVGVVTGSIGSEIHTGS